MQFQDSAGATWQFELDVPAVKRIRKLAAINLLATDVGGLLETLADPVNFIDCLYAACQPQAAERSISDEEFGRLMGVPIEPIAEQFLEELADFTLSLGNDVAAMLLRKVLIRAKKIQTTNPSGAILAKIEPAIDREFDRLEAAIAKATSGPPSGDSPASSALTPTNLE